MIWSIIQHNVITESCVVVIFCVSSHRDLQKKEKGLGEGEGEGGKKGVKKEEGGPIKERG